MYAEVMLKSIQQKESTVNHQSDDDLQEMVHTGYSSNAKVLTILIQDISMNVLVYSSSMFMHNHSRAVILGSEPHYELHGI